MGTDLQRGIGRGVVAGSIGLMLGALVAAGAAQAQTQVTIDLVFEPGVASTLKKRGEWVVVSAWYYGEPAKAGVPTDELGLVYLGDEEATVFATDQRLVLGGTTAGAPAAWVLEPQINVNVFTARITDENNLLDCGIVEGPVAVLAAGVQQISCRLLGAP
jgi:hypothetical protein